MKNRKLANGIMVAIILVIFAAGILAAGGVLGWFDRADGSQAVLTEVRGLVNLERDGVLYPVSGETVLRQKDRITCTPGATAVISLGDGSLTLGQKAAVTVEVPEGKGFAATVEAGEVFANLTSPATLTFGSRTVTFQNTVACLSVRSGAQSVSVFAGSVEEAQAGQLLDWVGSEESMQALSIDSLNDFTITQLRKAGSSIALCFTSEDLDRLQARRAAATQELLIEAVHATQPPVPSQPDPTETVPETEPQATSDSAESQTATEPQPTESAPSQPTEPVPTETQPPVTEPKKTCTLSIRCDTILNNMDALDPAKAGFVPADGVILYPMTVEFQDGETVFDVLKRVCNTLGIQLEYSWTPMYDSYYIEGIHNLYEFDCGSESGWMYKVNGWFPNYGCSSYPLEEGDTIVWCYTCVGLGADVGGPNW